MIKAIIFDFDGVLVLSEKPRFSVIQKVAANYNVTIADGEISKMVGRTTINFLTDVLADSEISLMTKIIDDYEKEYKGNITKYVEPINVSVNFIKNYKGSLTFALASMSSRRVVEELTKYFGIYEKFKSIICKEDVANHKPNPEIYLKSVEALCYKPSECVVIEDTIIGAQSAINANMKCYVLLNEFNKKEEFDGISIAGFINGQEDLENIG